LDTLRRKRRDYIKTYEQLLKEINNPKVKAEGLKHNEDIILKKINNLKNTELAKDLFEELHEKYNTQYIKLIANNTEELANELKRQIDEEKSSKNIENIKGKIDKLKEINIELGENIEKLQTIKYDTLEENINGLYKHLQSLLDAVLLDNVKKLNNDKLLNNKQKELLESLFNKKLSELNKKVMNEEKEKYTKIEKMINKCEDPIDK
ncbi:11424_t:CDS:2, partial [Dentiscutata erythropus]